MTDERTILIIDDNVNLALGFTTLLRNVGYTVHTAFTAADGLSLAQRHRLDAITVDFRMPLINGAGFLYRLRDLPDHHHTPVMIVTGMAISDEQQADFAALHAVVKFKPIDATDLLSEIGMVLAQMPPRRQESMVNARTA